MPAIRLIGAAASVLLFVAHSVSAVTLSAGGIGQALIYPYYTVNKNQDTLISVANASDVSKAVQVRFLEGYNGRDTLDFVVYLSPHDVWTAAITQTADDGGAALTTSDRSCTFPTIPSSGVQMRSAGYDGTGTVPADPGPTSITRTREGWIEFLLGADITPGSPTDIAITHVQNGSPGEGVPPGCATLNDTSALPDEVTPTEGIFGSGTIIDVSEGTFFAYDADAIQGFTSVPLFSPASDTLVSIEDANSSEAVGGVARSYVSDGEGTSFALDYAFGVDAVSAVFMADTIYNEYVVDASLGASTDWVITFPTKNFYVDKDLYPANPTAPFETAFVAPGISDITVEGMVYDREEGAEPFGGPCELCPPVTPLPVLSYQVNVAGFRTGAPTDPSPVLGSNLGSVSIPPFGDDGNMMMNFNLSTPHSLPGGLDSTGAAVTLGGLPAIGFMVYNVINANAQPGLLANYSGAFPHRTKVSCQGGGGTETCGAIIMGATKSHAVMRPE
ncbi:MAG TPA: hypothetical protein VGO25_11685 [Rhodanobacteraceae bacterium]|jgi:hypothetical protein|nr:hypothetical protein [Rhodanobacteraceae bacterium]